MRLKNKIIVSILLGWVAVSPAWALTVTEVEKLLASDGAAGDSFGTYVSVDGDTAVIGARNDDDNGHNSGAVYVFVRNGGVWTEQQKLLASDGVAGDQFGWSVSVDGNTAVIGAPFAEGDGAAYVFVRNGSVWSEQQKLFASDGLAVDFGWSVSVDGDTAVIGDDEAHDYTGAAYVFVRSGGVWSE